MSSPDVAAYLGISDRKLRQLREVGDGPPFERYGRRIVYRRTGVDEWIATHARVVTDPPPRAGVTWTDFGAMDTPPINPDEPDPDYSLREPDPDEFDPNLDR